ncbi:MAG: family 65 glycosyl hydrolase, partial [candidate division WS1 bacterium]|nr:family 65 glycosyl hydrolase [candidate division WS1 bacterium]
LMPKEATRYLELDPWAIVERGFHPEEGEVSESLFSLGNEYMGVRGYFEEGYSGPRLVGAYFNGVFEEYDFHHPQTFKGFATRGTFMVNSVDWLHARLWIDGEQLDLAVSKFTDFERRLDLKTGVLTRSFTWRTQSGKSVRVHFERFLSMAEARLGMQRITLEAVDSPCSLTAETGLDLSLPHMDQGGKNYWTVLRKTIPLGDRRAFVGPDANPTFQGLLLGQTERSRQRVLSSFSLRASAPVAPEAAEAEKLIAGRLALELEPAKALTLEKTVVNCVEKDPAVPDEALLEQGRALLEAHRDTGWDQALAASRAYWDQVWQDLDVVIEGDPENQQGVRYCIFQLHQTYHGQDPHLNVGAKGLTGEAYWGATFWDTETYCLPFYLFNNPQAARNLLLYRYQTLPQALERAVEMDCQGACYPFVTIDGTESCGVWQHGNLEVHIGAGLAYAIRHYVRICDDRDFLYHEGIEMLLQISRYFASRGEWGPRTGQFGMWGVMGADEFHMMVHNNCYTNFMVKKCFEYTLSVLKEMQEKAPQQLAEVTEKVGLEEGEPREWQRMAE